MAEPAEPSRGELEAALHEADDMFRVRGNRVTVRNPVRPYALSGLALGVVTTIALVVLGDAEYDGELLGGFVLAGLLMLGGAAAALGLVLGVVGFALRAAWSAARVLLGVALGCLVAVVVAMAASVVFGLGE